MTKPKTPDKLGHFGIYGGRYISETLMPAVMELEEAYLKWKKDPDFKKELAYYLSEYVGRPTPLYHAERLTKKAGGANIFLKREDLCHTGAHKINNTIGQILLAKRMGKKRVIAETGAGQHGVATATVAAMFGLECEVYMGEDDIKRQMANVFRMKSLGRRRQQRHGPFPPVPRRQEGKDDGRRGCRLRPQDRQARSLDQRRQGRSAPRQQDLSPSGRVRPDYRHPFPITRPP